MRREQPVCAACGARFQLDDFTEELGELVACPYCGSFEIEIEPLAEEPAGEEQAGKPEQHAA